MLLRTICCLLLCVTFLGNQEEAHAEKLKFNIEIPGPNAKLTLTPFPNEDSSQGKFYLDGPFTNNRRGTWDTVWKEYTQTIRLKHYESKEVNDIVFTYVHVSYFEINWSELTTRFRRRLIFITEDGKESMRDDDSGWSEPGGFTGGSGVKGDPYEAWLPVGAEPNDTTEFSFHYPNR